MADETPWPEFSIPTISDASAPASTPTPESVPVVAAPPASTPSPVATTTPVEELFPKHRYDELHSRYDAERQRNDQLTTILGKIADVKQAMATDEQQRQPPDPRKQQILADLIEAVGPEFQGALDLAKRTKDFDSLFARFDALERREAAREADAQEGRRQQTARDTDYARRSLSAIHDKIAPLFLGKDKKGTDLDDFRRQELTNQYIRWVGLEPARVGRYNEGDEALRDEFTAFYAKQWVEPFRRETSAAAVRAARVVSTLPVGGTTTSTLGTPPAKPSTDDDEDAPFLRAAKMAMELKNAGV